MWQVKLLYAIFAGIAFLFSVLYLPNFSVYLLVCILLFPILLWISVRICRTHIQVKLLFPNGNLFPRSSFTGTIILKNTSWIPISTAAVSLSAVHSISGETVSFEQQAAIPPKGAARLTFSLRSDHCGYISIHLEKIRLLDSLHLFSCTKPLETRQDLLIQPRIPEPPEQIALSVASSGDTLQAVPEPEELMGVREYRQGDRMRFIHWKLSSRFPDPVVREFGVPVSTAVTAVFLYGMETGVPNFAGRLDTMLEAMSALTHAVCAKGQSITWTVSNGTSCKRFVLAAPAELIPLYDQFLHEAPSAAPVHCQDLVLSANADAASFYITDAVVQVPASSTVFTAIPFSGGAQTVFLPAGSSAETVYRTLSKSSERNMV